jgi:hypothetical protein
MHPLDEKGKCDTGWTLRAALTQVNAERCRDASRVRQLRGLAKIRHNAPVLDAKSQDAASRWLCEMARGSLIKGSDRGKSSLHWLPEPSLLFLRFTPNSFRD